MNKQNIVIPSEIGLTAVTPGRWIVISWAYGLLTFKQKRWSR